MNESFNSAGQQWAWDATSIERIMKCPRYYYYKAIEGWEPKQPSAHLIFGGIYAKALETYYVKISEGLDEEAALHFIVRQALIESYEKPFNYKTKTRENLIRTIIWYFEHFKDSNVETYILENGKPAVELSFKLEIDENLIYCGHLDRVVTLNDKIYVMDQKTSGSTIGTYWFKQFDLSFQMSGYAVAGQVIFNIPVKGVIIDGAQIAVGFSRFERGYTFRNKYSNEEWLRQLRYWSTHANQFDPTDENDWPQNFASCGNYGGCEFRDVCASIPRLRSSALAADFDRKETWNPLKER